MRVITQRVGSHHMQGQQMLLARLRKARLRQLRPARERGAPLRGRRYGVRERAGQRSVELLRTEQVL